MLITSFYWIPALEQVMHVTFKAQTDPLYHFKDHLLEYDQLTTIFFGVVMIIIMLFVFIVCLISKVKHKEGYSLSNRLILLSLLIIVCLHRNPLWNMFAEKLNFFQFSFRFMPLEVTLVVIAFCSLPIIRTACKKIENKEVTFFVVFAFIIMITTNYNFYLVNADGKDMMQYIDETTENILQINGVGTGEEWLPSKCLVDALTETNASKANDGSGADGVKAQNGKIYNVWLLLDKEYYDVPYVYYYGYKAYLLDENEKITMELRTDIAKDDNGLLRVYMPENQSGVAQIMVTYRKTLAQKFSYVLSIISVVFVLVWLWISSRFQIVRRK